MNSANIDCPLTSWFKMRIHLVSVVVLFFAGYFFYDGTIGYPQKNLSYYYHKAFKDAGEQYRELKASNQFDLATWNQSLETKLVFKDVDAKKLPSGTDLGETWPQELERIEEIESKLYEKMPTQALWVDFVGRKGLKGTKVEREAKSANTILWQFISGYVALFLGIISVLVYLFMRNRVLSIGEQGIILPSKKRVLFTDITEVDASKWDAKGLAYIFYKEGELSKKARIDGFVYGGFNDENGTAESFMQALKDQRRAS